MEIIYEIAGETLVASLFGELDHHCAEGIRRDIDGMLEQYGAKHLVFDFRRVTFMDSSGIGVVLGRYKLRKAAGGLVVIAACAPRIQNILNMAGIFSLMEYADSREEALTYINRKEVS